MTRAFDSRDPLAPDRLQRLLEREAPASYLADAGAQIAAPKTTSQVATEAVIVFEIRDEYLTLPLSILQEVAYDCVFHRLPPRPGVDGIVNVRGELLVCVSLDRLTGTAPAPPPNNAPNTIARLLVCEREGLRVAFPVKSIQGTMQYHPAERVAVPATVAAGKSNLSQAVLRWRGRTAGCLDDGLLFSALKRRLS